MKHFAAALTLALFAALALNAQTSRSADDASSIRATVANYIEAYYTGDAPRMQHTLHPHYRKLMLHGNIPVRQYTGTDMIGMVQSGAPDIPAASNTEQVSVLDISGNIASAKLVTPGWVDYMTLSKVDGAWKILSVVQQIED
ncbi:MAG TPA: nuclear transport factor 2 family protein [Candidatus Sulfotelmatobacter sp.]|nr:nuclear transport factor 2 family protein [Candidatus Sulfotelmatobacter sp.]